MADDKTRIQIQTETKTAGIPDIYMGFGYVLCGFSVFKLGIISGLVLSTIYFATLWFIYNSDPRGLTVWLKIMRANMDVIVPGGKRGRVKFFKK